MKATIAATKVGTVPLRGKEVLRINFLSLLVEGDTVRSLNYEVSILYNNRNTAPTRYNTKRLKTMKNVIILHGTDGSPEQNWFPWLKKKLEARNYKVWVPLLPGNHTPNRRVYNDFLLSSDWEFKDSIVIGHSSGAVSVLNLLMDERCPQVEMAIMVSAWKSGVPLRYEKDNQQFVDLFPPEGFNFEIIKQKADKIAFLHSDNDPYCPLGQAKYLAEQLNAPLNIVHNGDHLGSKFKELPQLWDILEPRL